MIFIAHHTIIAAMQVICETYPTDILHFRGNLTIRTGQMFFKIGEKLLHKEITGRIIRDQP